ncbi:MAG: hypothetical protein IT546_12675 [Caulobacteraceae bacterium]|nr:hypothetical protein [Caulobacteraceae bacterium]
MRLVLCSVIALSVLATAAAAETTPVETAPQSTEDQIDAYLRSSPALSLPSDEEIDALQEARERKVHGEVAVAVGSHGYRDVYARSDFPVGKTGTLSLAVRDSRFKGRFGRHERQGVSLGLAMGDAATARDCRWAMPHDAPEPGRNEGGRCEADRIHRLGPAPLGRPMF